MGSDRLPAYLYKYCKVNEFTKRFVVDHEIYFAKPSQFNDPFDSRVFFRFSTEERRLGKAFVEMTTRYSYDAAVDMVAAVLDPKQRERYERDVQILNDRLGERFGIACFAERPDDILMWSDYAERHRGICVEIDTRRLELRYQNRLFKVTYQEEYPTTNILGDVDELTPLVCTKAKNWEYEQEWRCLSKPGSVTTVSRRVISKVILGCRISSTDEHEVRSWLKVRNKQVALSRAERNINSFGLSIVPARKAK